MAWDPRRDLAVLTAKAVPLADPTIDAGLTHLRGAFVDVLGPGAAGRFDPPAELRAWLRVMGGAPVSSRLHFYDLQTMIAQTEDWLQAYLWGADDDERPADGPWVQVGRHGDKHGYFLCCDRDHPEWGHVARGHDVVPWMDEDALRWDVDVHRGLQERDRRQRSTLQDLVSSVAQWSRQR